MIIITIFSYNIYPQTNTDWQWFHPKQHGNDIRFIKMLSPNNWVAVGYTGTLMRSTNAGLNWLVYSNDFGFYALFLGQGKNIYDGDIYNSTGVACGTQGYIARTTNVGVSWDLIGSPAGKTALWNANFGSSNPFTGTKYI